MDYPAPVRLLSAAGQLSMPFTDAIKYCILGISVTLLLLALAILAWQAFRCCTQTNTAYNQQDLVNSELLHSDEKSITAGKSSGAPCTRVENVSADVLRLSRCLSQASSSSSGSSQADGDMGEQTNIKKRFGSRMGRILCFLSMFRGRVRRRIGLLHITTSPVSGDGSCSSLEVEDVDGSLRFSVYYDQLQSQLVVTVLQVEGLLEHSQTRSLQPFVKLRLMWAGSEAVEVEDCTDEGGKGMAPVLWTVLQEWQTRIVKGSCNPLFGDQFSCALQEEKERHHINLRMEVLLHTDPSVLSVRDFDKFSRHTVLGEVRVPLGQLNISYPLELQEDLKIPQKDLIGEVLLSLKFLPTSQRLEVGLLKVRTVLTEICSDAALYARISVQCNQCKLRYQKTSAVAHCLMTVFNEVLMFSLPEIPLDQCKILVSVYETHMTRKTPKHLIGQLTVGKEKTSEDKHWSLMMRSVRKPVAKWHGLLI